jgi:hypothetical protein
VGSLVRRLQGVQIGQGAAEDVDDFVELRAVDPQLGVAVGHRVDRLIALEAIALEAEAFGQLVDLGDDDEVEVLLAEVALALRAVDRVLGRRLDQFDHELPLALRALEDFRQHGSSNSEDCATLRDAKRME